jgi:hypothetical protein
MFLFSKTSLVILASSTLLAIGLGETALAGQLNWNYTVDSFSDGVTDRIVGNNGTPGFEIFGTAYAQNQNRLYVAINSNLVEGGVSNRSALGRKIDFGDFFFNFSTNKTFNEAMNSGDIYGVRFAAANDSNTPAGLGVYGGVKAGNVSLNNNGFGTLNDYVRYVESAGQTASFGDIALNSNYFQTNGNVLNVIDTYKSVVTNDVTFINDFSALGLNFANNFSRTGAYTYGFSFDISKLPTGDFIAHLFEECANDAIGIKGKINPWIDNGDPGAKVPESSTVLALLSLGLVGLAFKQNRSLSLKKLS